MQIALWIWNKAINKREAGTGRQIEENRMTSVTLTKKPNRARKRYNLVVSKEILSEWYRWADITCYENNDIFNCGYLNPMGFVRTL